MPWSQVWHHHDGWWFCYKQMKIIGLSILCIGIDVDSFRQWRVTYAHSQNLPMVVQSNGSLWIAVRHITAWRLLICDLNRMISVGPIRSRPRQWLCMIVSSHSDSSYSSSSSSCECLQDCAKTSLWNLLRLCATGISVIFVNEKENENGEKRENNEFVNEN